MKYLNQTEYAAHRGITQQRVSQLIRDGYFKGALKNFGSRKLIDLEKADRFLSERLRQDKCKSQGKAEQQQVIKQAGLELVTLAEAQRLKVNYEAAIRKLDFEKENGALVNAEQVEKDFFNSARRVRDSILNIPNHISAELATLTDIHAVSIKLTTELTAALEELSR